MPDHFRGVVKNRQTIQATVRARGFTNRDILAHLIVTDPAGNEETVATRSIAVSQDDQQFQLNLTLTPQKAGSYRITVRIDPQPEEITSINNELSAFMTIFDGGLRVLFIHADVSAESRYLNWALNSSEEIQLDTVQVLSRNQDLWPLDLSPAIQNGNYDAFIIEDVDSRALTPSTLAALAERVEQGKGLIMLGGLHSFGPGMYAQTPLADLLPVKMNLLKQDFNAPILDQMHINRELKVRPTANHFVTNLDESDQHDIWNRLPPLVGANVLDPKDNAQILLESDDGHPILISQTVGGRVLAMACDSTWRWYAGGFQSAYKRFWRQIVLWLVFRDNLTDSNVLIELAQRRFEPFSPVQFGLDARNASGGRIAGCRYTALLRTPTGKTEAVPITSNDAATHGLIGSQTLADPGLYTIDAQAFDAANGQQIGTAQAQFMVYDRDKEKSNPAGDPDQLARMSSRTKAWGGHCSAPKNLVRCSTKSWPILRR